MELKAVSKALAGAAATLLAVLLLKVGVILTPEVSDAVQVVLEFAFAGVLGFGLVFLAPKNKT